MKAKVPEAYELWIETTRKRNDHELWQSKKATRQPYLLASLGQWLGLVAVEPRIIAQLDTPGDVKHAFVQVEHEADNRARIIRDRRG
ncbi:hypothetical protein ACNQP7_31970 [Mycolicibacterium fortuitum]|uniref:hypothetical protein n=1 Tax=Mycolicibacterium fortuitum TaxID=1766 RepID=UPI003AB0853F